jgi:hypothetical protein
MGAIREIGRYLKTAKDAAVEYSYLGFSALFFGAGLCMVQTDDLEKLGYGLLGAGLTQAVYGTGRRLREKRRDKARERKERAAELQLKRMELRQRRIAEDLRELTERDMRRRGKKVRITMEVVDEMGESEGDIGCKLQALDDAMPDDRSSSVEIDAVEFRRYLREKTSPPGGIPGGSGPCLPGYPT